MYIGYGVGGRSLERDRASEFAARGNPARATVLSAWNDTVQMMQRGVLRPGCRRS